MGDRVDRLPDLGAQGRSSRERRASRARPPSVSAPARAALAVSTWGRPSVRPATWTAAATILVLAPVNYHRLLFRQQQKEWLVLIGNNCARAGLVLSAAAVTGVLGLLFDFVAGGVAGHIAAMICALGFGSVRLGLPMLSRRRDLMAATPRRFPREREVSSER